MSNSVSQRSTVEKALRLNLDQNKYGTIAEIGAGQEVARQFFRAGAAAGTIAKTISAYDMQFSDAIYGIQENRRYVSMTRARAMIEREFDLVVERVGDIRPRASRYFAYAATIAARSFKGDNECHAWCGIRLQMYPGAEPSDIIVHVRMLDKLVERQQTTLGIFGVNLIYAAYYYFEEPKKLIDSLTDNLEDHRLEIDYIDMTGPYFEDIDIRAMNLHLIRSWKTRAIMFNQHGQVTIPSEMLYKKNVLTIRGTFRPVTRLNVDMIEQGLKFFTELDGVSEDNSIALAEISLNDQRGKDLNVSEEDLVKRVDLLNSLGYSVMISDHTRYFSLRAYFRQFTKMQIGIVCGMINIREIFNPQMYTGIEGGILEGFGKLFQDNTRLLVYPELNPRGELTKHTEVEIPGNLQCLYQHLLDNNFIFGIECSDPALLGIYSAEVHDQIKNGHGDWEAKLPPGIPEQIMDNRWFGFRP